MENRNYKHKKKESNENVNVNGNDNGTYKRDVNFESTEKKHIVIAQLKTCNYQTPPIKVAKLLEELFIDCWEDDNHAFYFDIGKDIWHDAHHQELTHKLYKELAKYPGLFDKGLKLE